MKVDIKRISLVGSVLCLLLVTGCTKAVLRTTGGDDDNTDSDTTGTDQPDAGGDADTNTETGFVSVDIPTTCAEAEEASTSVGCLFFAVDLDSHDYAEELQFAVAISNVNQTDTAEVTVSQGSASGWQAAGQASVAPMSLHVFELPDYHQDDSGLMEDGSFKIESDVPIIAYQFNPVDGEESYLSDASMLIPVTSLTETYDIVGWKQTTDMSDQRAYFTVVAVVDGTQVTVEPSVSPLAGGVVPAGTAPFVVEMNEGDVLEVATENELDNLTGTRVTSNNDHPIAVFSGQECAFVPDDFFACDHLEEQLPGLKFWGREFVAARMPVRSVSALTEDVLWQIYASEDNTQVTLSASGGVVGLPFSQTTLQKGELVEMLVSGTQSEPGDFLVRADKPIALMQYMTGQLVPYAEFGDPAMVYVGPTEQFLSRYVVLVPTTWVHDMLVISRLAGNEVLLDGAPIPESAFKPVASSAYEVARIAVADGVHSLASTDPAKSFAVLVVGWDQTDSYAYTGGTGLFEINSIE